MITDTLKTSTTADFFNKIGKQHTDDELFFAGLGFNQNGVGGFFWRITIMRAEHRRIRQIRIAIQNLEGYAALF